MATWTTLSDGLFGAVLGASAVFTATVVTLWRTRVGDRNREAIRMAEVDLERRHRNVAEVIGIFRELEREVRAAPFAIARSQGAFLRAAMLFFMTQKPTHPDVAQWLVCRNDDYVVRLEKWRRLWWCPMIGTRRARNVAHLLGEIVAALVLWATGDLGDDAFSDEARSPADVARSNSATGAARAVGNN